jgi:hypothetical protein
MFEKPEQDNRRSTAISKVQNVRTEVLGFLTPVG